MGSSCPWDAELGAGIAKGREMQRMLCCSISPPPHLRADRGLGSSSSNQWALLQLGTEH